MQRVWIVEQEGCFARLVEWVYIAFGYARAKVNKGPRAAAAGWVPGQRSELPTRSPSPRGHPHAAGLKIQLINKIMENLFVL